MRMPSTVVEDKLSQRRVVSATLPACSLLRVSRSLSTLVRHAFSMFNRTPAPDNRFPQSKFNALKMLLVVSTQCSTGVVDKSSAKSSAPEHRCSLSRPTSLSTSPSVSPQTCVHIRRVRHSLRVCSITGRCKFF